MSENVRRRHLTSGQLGFLALGVLELERAQAKERQIRRPVDSVTRNPEEQNRNERTATAKAAKRVGTSRDTVDKAVKVLKHKDLAEKVKSGELAIDRADRGTSVGVTPALYRIECLDRKACPVWEVQEKEYAQRVTGLVAGMVPYLERGELIPYQKRGDFDVVLDDITADGMVLGAILACDVALKRFATVIKRSLPEAAWVIAKLLALQKATDVAHWGANAYDDGQRGVRLLAKAMVNRTDIDFEEEFETPRRVALAYLAVLFQLVLQLAHVHGITPTESVQKLALEITTVKTNSH